MLLNRRNLLRCHASMNIVSCRRVRRMAMLAAIVVAAGCSGPFEPDRPQATLTILDELSPDSVLVNADTRGRLRVTARMHFYCETHPMVASVRQSAGTLTLTVERHFPGPCQIGFGRDISYLAEMSALRSGPWTFRVVHEYPEILLPPPPDTVFFGQVVVP
jgi:hypothetical protein